MRYLWALCILAAFLLQMTTGNVGASTHRQKANEPNELPSGSSESPQWKQDSGVSNPQSDSAESAVQSVFPPGLDIAAPVVPAVNSSGETTPDVNPLVEKELINAPLALSEAGVAVAEKLRHLLATRAERFFDRKDERNGVQVFYRDRGFRPLWFDGSEAAPRTAKAVTFLQGVQAEGLDPKDYPVPDLRSGDAGKLAESELKLTHAILDYARHAQTGRVHFSRISADISYVQNAPEVSEVLSQVATADDVRALLNSFNPAHAGYQALKAKLAEIRSRKGAIGPHIATGPVLRAGKTLANDDRVPLLRKRLGISIKSNTKYDDELASAVAGFQRQHGIAATGNLTRSTVEALNNPQQDRDASIIIANMERWRWMPRDLGRSYSILNIPDFTLKLISDETVVWQTKVVVGKPATPTPLISDMMKYITVNPTWNVPPSIVQNEYLPALQRDPRALSRMGIEVVQNPDGSLRMYQPPGERNALGRLRFNFPNKFLVYQHDTSDKRLFDQERRAYSHGCMRVKNPEQYAEMLFSITQSQPSYTADRLRKMFGTREQNISLARPLPVHITYQTAFVTEEGRLVFRDDLYGHDARFFALMKGEERQVADIVSRPRVSPATVAKPARAPAARRPLYSGGFLGGLVR